MLQRLIFSLSVIFILLVNHSFAQSLHVDETNSPYSLPNGYEVSPGDSLILHPGAILEIGDFKNIIIRGVFRSYGTAENQVTIRAIDPSQGWGILDIKNTSDSLIMKHTLVKEGRLAVNDCPIILYETHITNNQPLQWGDMVFRVWFSSIDLSYSSITGSNQGEGLICHDCINPTIRYCRFEKMPDAIELINCDGGNIRGNTFDNLNDDAIDLNHCSDVLIDSNFISNVANRGLEIGSEAFGSCSNISIRRNCFFNCYEAVNFKEGSTGRVTNNTFFKNNTAVVTLSAAGFAQEVVEVENCIFEKNNIDVYIDTNSLLSVDYSCFSSEPVSGDGNFHGAPLFINPEKGDFQLKEYSQCINAGLPTLTDVDGSRSDIGAFHRSIQNVDSPESIKLWPNPAADLVYLRLIEEYNELMILNSQGEVLKTVSLAGRSNLFQDVQGFSSGVYYFWFLSDSREETILVYKI